MTAEDEFDDVARDLHEMRAEPRPDYARELDRRAAAWLQERPRRRLPSIRILIPAAAAAAALVIALAVSGGGNGGGGDDEGRLDVAVISEGVPGAESAPGGGAAAPEGLAAPLERDSTQAPGGAFLLMTKEGETVTVRYVFSAPARATVELAGRDAEVEVGPGPGSLEISTEGLPPGTHDLTITAPPAPTYRERVQIGG